MHASRVHVLKCPHLGVVRNEISVQLQRRSSGNLSHRERRLHQITRWCRQILTLSIGSNLKRDTYLNSYFNCKPNNKNIPHLLWTQLDETTRGEKDELLAPRSPFFPLCVFYYHLSVPVQCTHIRLHMAASLYFASSPRYQPVPVCGNCGQILPQPQTPLVFHMLLHFSSDVANIISYTSAKI